MKIWRVIRLLNLSITARLWEHRGKHKIFQGLSSIAGTSTKYGNVDQGICCCLLFSHCSCVIKSPRHSFPQRLLLLSSKLMGRNGHTPKPRRKQFLKTGAVEQSAEPPPWFPGTETWSSARLLRRIFWVNLVALPSFLHVLSALQLHRMSTNMLWEIMIAAKRKALPRIQQLQLWFLCSIELLQGESWE